MRWAIVGRGRLGRTLAELLPRAGHPIVTVGRGETIPTDVDGVLLCVPDNTVRALAFQCPPDRVVLHHSGALDHDVLLPLAHRGSLHPLMTFPGPEVAIPDLAGVPAAVAGTSAALAAAATLATDLGMVPFEVPGDRRLYHAAAVMAGNFATVLLAEAADVLVAAGIQPDRALSLLVPLARQSIENARYGIAQALTGPIARGDEITLDAHRTALDDHALGEVRALYDTLVKRARRRLPGPPRTGGDDP